MLSPYRVLDLSTERGLLCGQILGDLGADVIVVEPPGGAAARRCGPFYGGTPHPDRSLFWWSLNRNKRSLVLDLDAAAGQETLRRLARTAHFLVESDDPGAMARRGLGYTDLAAVNPALVYVSISPFGQDGPKAGYAESDLTLVAAAGPLYLCGDDDRPPVRISVPQSYLHAGAEAAVAALIAHHERVRSGRGQHVDVSVQQAVTLATQSYLLAAAVGDAEAVRYSGGSRTGPLVIRLVYPAKDGYVSITHLFGSSVGPATRRLMEYVHDEGGCDAATRDKDWIGFFDALIAGREPIAEHERVKQLIADFTATKTKAELYEAALARGLLVAPVATIDDVVHNPHWEARGYWCDLHHPELGRSIRYPGPFARFSAAPLSYRRRPPTVGEHSREVLAQEVGPGAVAARVTPARPATASAPLEGVKILDFMWALAGPGATRTLADYGATVVRVESSTRVDVCRTLRPWRGGVYGVENCTIFHTANAGKRMLTLDIGKPEGCAVVRDLVRWADVVTEAFAPKAKQRVGLDYESLRALQPDLIMLSTCLMGQSGPLADFAGFGNLAAAVTGFYELTGWPDRPPAGPFGAYTDYIAPRFNAIAILAALEHRRQTGRGQHIDLAQSEAALHFLAPAILEYTANGHVPSRDGNRDRGSAPHGVYPAAGDERWIALAVRTDAEWQALCAVMERPDLAREPRFATTAGRLTHADALDPIIAAWTRHSDAHVVESVLQAQGIPASAVQNSHDVCGDPQLIHRGHFVSVAHPSHGTTTIEGSRFQLSRTPACMDTSVPTLGRDSQYVLEHILGYSEERITELLLAGVLE